jgi:hypothetical protein
MPADLALKLLLITFAGFVNRDQSRLIAYLLEENSIFRELQGKKRPRLTDNQRSRLAVKGKPFGGRLLAKFATIVTPHSPRAPALAVRSPASAKQARKQKDRSHVELTNPNVHSQPSRCRHRACATGHIPADRHDAKRGLARAEWLLWHRRDCCSHAATRHVAVVGRIVPRTARIETSQFAQAVTRSQVCL